MPVTVNRNQPKLPVPTPQTEEEIKKDADAQFYQDHFDTYFNNNTPHKERPEVLFGRTIDTGLYIFVLHYEDRTIHRAFLMEDEYGSSMIEV
jgi:hypothetical protein